MSLTVPWSPRVIMTGRLFRLPVQTGGQAPELEARGFELVDSRWSPADEAHFYYLRSPLEGGDYEISARAEGEVRSVTVAVRNLDELRQPHDYNGVSWPRRWPAGSDWHSTKNRQTLEDEPHSSVREETLRWWTAQDDAVLWRQLPPAEMPRAHYVNVHQGCPRCGTAIFSHHGFYPWKRDHLPWTLRSECPSCAAVFPSNDLASGDFSSGDFVDDGFGYFDADGHVFLFAASCNRDLVGQYLSPISALTAHLRSVAFDEEIARQLGLLVLRWSLEEVYVAAVPQYRHGPSQEVEKAWDWGQPDWAAEADPIGALNRKGSLSYAIDVPGAGNALAQAYDTIWPLLRNDQELVDRVGLLGLKLQGPEDAASLIEEALASLIQCAVDGAALSNKPRVSEGVLTMLRCLDRPDAQDVIEWLYDRGPDRLRVFATNNFTPDGVPPEAAGGYNNTHTSGLFSLEYHMRQLRALHPQAYPEDAFPSPLADPRVERIFQAPYEVAMMGKIPFHFGDGGSAGVQSRMGDDVYLDPLNELTLDRAVKFVDRPSVSAIRDSVRAREHRRLGSVVQDGVGIAILRTDECPERAATGIIYGDAPWHRHSDLLDVQLYAFDRPFLSDLGYPQSWGSVEYWEGHWSTHNSVWAIVPGVEPLKLPFDTPWHYLKQIAGRGRLVRSLSAPGIQLVEVEARRWSFDPEHLRWFDPGVRFRRLIGLVETDGEGLALIDLSRISGGSEHWRLCRGLEGTFDIEGAEFVPRPGTLAGEDVVRGDFRAVDHGDRTGLSWMDDVAVVRAAEQWRGTWTFCREESGGLDLYQLHVSPDTQVLTARAAATMGTPEESKYCYRPLAWRRQVADSTDETHVDLIFEPRVGPRTLSSATSIPAEGDASGVLINTTAGRQIAVYWAPGDEEEAATTTFSDGTTITAGLAVSCDGEVYHGAGCDRLARDGSTVSFQHAVQQGTIVDLDIGDCAIVVEGLEEVTVGDRLSINPQGRGHTYRVEEVAPLAEGHHRLTLDMTSVLGRSSISSIDGPVLELDFHLNTRTANLHQTRLQRESDDTWQVIVEAVNPDMDTTRIHLAAPLENARPGDWVSVVDYVAGDAVRLEATRSATARSG